MINGQRYTSDVIIYRDRVDDKWWRRKGHQLCVEDIEEAVQEKPEVLVVGTGYFGLMKVLPETKAFLASEKIELIVEKTRKACERFNEVHKSKRAVAALHLTC